MDRKYMSNFLRRQSFVILSSLVVVVLSITLASTAIFTFSQNSSEDQLSESSKFFVTFVNGSKITNDVYITEDSEGMASTPYEFTVKNEDESGNASTVSVSYVILVGRSSNASNHIDNNYIKYSIDGEAPRTLGNSNVYSGTDDTNKMYSIKVNNLSAGGSKTHYLRVWIDKSAADDANVVGKTVSLSIQVIAATSDPSASDSNNIKNGYQFEYTGTEATYIVPYTGTYTIVAAGAEGNTGNLYDYFSNNYRGGKGAKISAEFDLVQGDILHIVVGGQGNTTTGTNVNGASGAGGGGSFVFKEIESVTNSNYEFTKSATNLQTLLVAAGGNGTGDIAFSNDYRTNANNGNGANYKSPSNYTAYSTTTASSSSTALSSPLGISQYITYNSAGGTFTKNSSVCSGGYGGGGCNDNDQSYGGGWSGADYVTYSWSLGSNTTGIDGSQEGNGYVNIKLND